MKKQPLKDKSCLVPCTGIYADVTEERFLQQLRRQKYSNSTHVKNHENELHSLTEEYWRYKRSYVKQLGFDPKEENLSRFICSQQTLSKLYICSPLAGGCTVRGGVHLLWHRNLRRVRERCEGDIGNNFVITDDMISHAWIMDLCIYAQCLGDNRGSIGVDWGHNGSPHWLLHTQWG